MIIVIIIMFIIIKPIIIIIIIIILFMISSSSSSMAIVAIIIIICDAYSSAFRFWLTASFEIVQSGKMGPATGRFELSEGILKWK